MNFKNSTFTISEPTWANACVGDNGNPQIIDYAEGYVKAANLLIDNLIADECRSLHVDAFIYPICFNMRHAVELHLKGVIENVKALATCQKKKLPEFSIVSTHDLGKAWKFIRENTPLVDKRYFSILAQLDEYINDIAEVDLTGQVFRYPYDVANRKHLIDVRIINVIVLKRRFSELAALLSELSHLSIKLIEEYENGSFTTKLSRQDLFELASKLPKRSQWESEGFAAAKISLMAEYELSSNDFCRALKIIKDNYEMSQFIDAPPALQAVDASILHTFFDCWTKIHNIEEVRNPKSPELICFTDFDDVDFNGDNIKNRHSQRKQWWSDNISIFTAVRISELRALYYFGQYLSYSESFKLLRNQYGNEAKADGVDKLQSHVYHLLKKTDAMSEMLNSLNFLGQAGLVNSLVERYDLHLCMDQLLQKSTRRKWSPVPVPLLS